MTASTSGAPGAGTVTPVCADVEGLPVLGKPCAPAGLERLRALAALAGLRVHRLDCGGGYLVIGPRGWCSRELPSVHALAQALRQQGVQV